MLRMEIDRARTATELEGIKSMLNDVRLQTEGSCKCVFVCVCVCLCVCVHVCVSLCSAPHFPLASATTLTTPVHDHS